MKKIKQNTTKLMKRIAVFLIAFVMIATSLGSVSEVISATTLENITTTMESTADVTSQSSNATISDTETTKFTKASSQATSETMVPAVGDDVSTASKPSKATTVTSTAASSATETDNYAEASNVVDATDFIDVENVKVTYEKADSAFDLFQPYWVDDTNLNIQKYKGLTLEPVYAKGSVNPVVVDATDYIQQKLNDGIEIDEENAFNLDVPLTLDNVNIFSRDNYPDDDRRQLYVLTLDRELLSPDFQGIVFPKGTLFDRLSGGLSFENHRLLMEPDAEYVKAIILVPMDWKGKVQILGETATPEMLQGEKTKNTSDDTVTSSETTTTIPADQTDSSSGNESKLTDKSVNIDNQVPKETIVPAPEKASEANSDNQGTATVASQVVTVTPEASSTTVDVDTSDDTTDNSTDTLTPNQARLLEENTVLKDVFVIYLDGVDTAGTKEVSFQDGMLAAVEIFMKEVQGQSRMTDAEHDEIMSTARYDIMTKPGLYESSENEVTESWGPGGTHLKISGQIDSTGQYVIWDVVGSYSQNFGTNRFMYFPFRPSPWLAMGQEIDKSMVTVDPFDLMTLVYNTPHSVYVSGYWNDYVDNFKGSSDEFTNVVLFWRAWQDSEGVTPIPPNLPIHMKIRTKIKEHDKAVYSMGVQAVMSKYVFKNDNDKWYTPLAFGKVAGKMAYFRIHLPFFDEQRGQLPNGEYVTDKLNLKIFKTSQGKKTLFKTLQLDRATMNAKNNLHSEYLPRWDEDGHKIEYTIEADRSQARVSALSQNTHEWKIVYQDASTHNLPLPTTVGGPFSEAKVDGTTYNRDGNMAVQANATYSLGGNHIIWTLTYQQFHGNKESGGMYFYTPTDFDPNAVDQDGNHIYPLDAGKDTLIMPSHDYVEGFPKAKVFSWYKWASYFYPSATGTEDYNVITPEGRKVDLKYKNHGLVWTDNVLNNGEKVVFQFITKINDEAKYNDTYSIVYKSYLNRGTTGTYGPAYKVTIEGRTIRPFAYFSVVDDISTEGRLELAKSMRISVRDDRGRTAGYLKFDESQNKFISETSLPRFDSDGRKINYTLHLDNQNAGLLADYDHYFSQYEALSARWEVALQKKRVYNLNDNTKWGVISLQPSIFEYNPDASTLDSRIPSGFRGMYGWLEGQWRVPNSMKRGDSFFLKLPNVYNIKAPTDFEIKSEQNETIFRVHVSPENNSLQFTATDYVDKYQNLAGTFRLGPLIASTFDNPDSVNDHPISFETYYQPLGLNGVLNSRYSINWNRNAYAGGTYDYIRKEELDEGSDYITYGIMLNRAQENINSIRMEDFFGGKGNSYRKFSFYKYGESPKPLQEYLKVYSVSRLGIGGVDRSELDEDHLIWPRRGTAPDITDAVVSGYSMKSNGYGFDLSLQKRSKPIGCIVVTVKTDKLTYEEGQPQVNEAWRGNQYSASTRYPTFGRGYGNGVLRNQQQGRIRIKKYDVTYSPEDLNGRLQGAKLALYQAGTFNPNDVDEGKLAEGVTDAQGELLFDGSFDPGLYDVYELEAPDGFVPLSAPFRLNLDGDTVIHNYYFENAPRRGIYLKKISRIQSNNSIPVHTGEGSGSFGRYEGIPLEGGTFQLYRVDPETHEEIKVGNPRTSGVNGVVNWDNITEPGVYFAEEIKAPDGYMISPLTPELNSSDSGYWFNRRVYFNVTKDPTLDIYYAPLQYAQNESEESEIWIYKVRKDSEEFSIPIFLQGATFALYKENAVEFEDGVPYLKVGAEPIDIQTSNAVGWLGFKHLDSNTQYYVKELRPPEGYKIIEDLIAIQTPKANKHVERIVVNKPVYEEKLIVLKKVDLDDRTTFLKDAYFDLIDDTGKVIDAGWTNQNGELRFGHLKPGMYKIRETRAPKDYKLGLVKVDVQGVDSDYELDEKNAMLINLGVEAATVSYTVANEKKEVFYDFLVRKQDADDGSRLKGVTFELLDEKKKVLQTRPTNDQGEISFTRLKEGIYYLREKTPLEGYSGQMVVPEGEPYKLQPDGTLQLKLTKDNEEFINLYIINNEKEYTPNFFLPYVGGSGYRLGMIAGSICFLAAAFVAVKQKKIKLSTFLSSKKSD